MAVAEFRVLPSRKTVAEMSEEERAVICAQALLINKISADSSPEGKYEQFTTTAASAPFLVLDRTRTVEEKRSVNIDQERSESVQVDAITKVLELLLPRTLPQTVTAAIQSVITESTQREGDKRISHRRESNGDQEIGFLLLETPSWSGRCFSVYFCKVKTSETEKRGWFKHEKDFSVVGECFHSKYTVTASIVTKIMERGGNARKTVDEFLKHAEDVRGIGQAPRDAGVRRLQQTANRPGLVTTRGQSLDTPPPQQQQQRQQSFGAQNVNQLYEPGDPLGVQPSPPHQQSRQPFGAETGDRPTPKQTQEQQYPEPSHR